MKITPSFLKKLGRAYHDDPKNELVSHAIAKVGIVQASIRQEALRRHDFNFSHTTKKGAITNQKQSGRCWMFAGYNVDRVKVMEKLGIDSFEFSQTYLFFWDKMEKANRFLTQIAEHADLPFNDRLMQHLLDSPVDDGNFWDCYISLTEKYGSVPKDCMPETFQSSSSHVMVEQMELRLMRAALRIIEAVRAKAPSSQVKKLHEEALAEVYNIACKALGEPPQEFTWRYMDKDKKFQSISSTPKAFYKKYVGHYRDKVVTLLHEPRSVYKNGSLLRLKYFKSIVEDSGVDFLVAPLKELKKATIKSIKAGEPVWFACDVKASHELSSGIMDTEIFDFDHTLTPLGTFTKAERVTLGVTGATHAMAITGVDLNDKGEPVTWQVENSWGDAHGRKGVYSMSDRWFDEYTFHVIVPRKYVSKQYIKDYDKKEPILVEPWDPVSTTNMIK